MRCCLNNFWGRSCCIIHTKTHSAYSRTILTQKGHA
jgi:hypothetical protein